MERKNRKNIKNPSQGDPGSFPTTASHKGSPPPKGYKLKAKKTEEYCFDIPLCLPSANKYLRMHWADRERLKRDFAIVIKARTRNLPRFSAVNQITLELSFKTNRRRDKMNYILSADKLIIDNLVKLGKIPDDSILDIPSIVWYNLPCENIRVRIRGKESK